MPVPNNQMNKKFIRPLNWTKNSHSLRNLRAEKKLDTQLEKDRTASKLGQRNEDLTKSDTNKIRAHPQSQCEGGPEKHEHTRAP